MKHFAKYLCVLLCLAFAIQACNQHKEALNASRAVTQQNQEKSNFYEFTMNAAPFLPKDQSTKNIACRLPEASYSTHTNSNDVNYADYGWEKRISHDWTFFTSPAQEGRILLIDIKQQNALMAYRYLANDNTQNHLYEPWSSSKIFAFTGAIAQLRKQHPSIASYPKLTHGLVGEHHIADMITSINSYEAFSKADGNSNAMASFFANLATRDYLTSLFYDEWLKLSTSHIYFRGAYGPSAFSPKTATWRSQEGDKELALTMNNEAAKDPGYLPYRCQNCGLTGNKPMSTLAQAEWLKRLAMHSLDAQTAHPYLVVDDVETLFYGSGHSQEPEKFAGMTLGISTMLQQAIAKTIDASNSDITPKHAKKVLDEASKGQWRVFQKIGWGPSETRSTTENVVLAYVCLPHYRGGRAFVVAAQVAVKDAKDENLAFAGLKMQALLDNAMKEYLHAF